MDWIDQVDATGEKKFTIVALKITSLLQFYVLAYLSFRTFFLPPLFPVCKEKRKKRKIQAQCKNNQYIANQLESFNSVDLCSAKTSNFLKRENQFPFCVFFLCMPIKDVFFNIIKFFFSFCEKVFICKFKTRRKIEVENDFI